MSDESSLTPGGDDGEGGGWVVEMQRRNKLWRWSSGPPGPPGFQGQAHHTSEGQNIFDFFLKNWTKGTFTDIREAGK